MTVKWSLMGGIKLTWCDDADLQMSLLFGPLVGTFSVGEKETPRQWRHGSLSGNMPPSCGSSNKLHKVCSAKGSSFSPEFKLQSYKLSSSTLKALCLNLTEIWTSAVFRWWSRVVSVMTPREQLRKMTALGEQGALDEKHWYRLVNGMSAGGEK